MPRADSLRRYSRSASTVSRWIGIASGGEGIHHQIVEGVIALLGKRQARITKQDIRLRQTPGEIAKEGWRGGDVDDRRIDLIKAPAVAGRRVTRHRTGSQADNSDA